MVIFARAFTCRRLWRLSKSLLSASGQTDVMITHKTGEAFSVSTLNKIKRIDGMPSSPGRSSAPSTFRRTFTAGLDGHCAGAGWH